MLGDALWIDIYYVAKPERFQPSGLFIKKIEALNHTTEVTSNGNYLIEYTIILCNNFYQYLSIKYRRNKTKF